jgi:hypothetical protein
MYLHRIVILVVWRALITTTLASDRHGIASGIVWMLIVIS